MLTGVRRDAAADEGGAGGGESSEARIAQMRAEIQALRAERLAAEATAAAARKKEGISTALDKFEYVKPSAREAAYRHVREDVQEINGSLYGPDYSTLDEYLANLFAGDLSTLVASKTSGAARRASAVDLNDIKPGSAHLEKARTRIGELVAEQFAPLGVAASLSRKVSAGEGVDVDDIWPGSPKLETARKAVSKMCDEMLKRK
jgi:hypothetical protein